MTDISFEHGGYLLVKRAMGLLSAGETLTISGASSEVGVRLRAWCRKEGHEFLTDSNSVAVVKGTASDERWSGAQRAGHANPLKPGAIAPDPVTAAVCRLAAQDEARRVAFGMSHLREHISREPDVLGRLANAVRRRHDALQHTAGLNTEVFDSLVLIAAGSWEPADLRRPHQAVAGLVEDMYGGRAKRLVRIGFSEEEARELSSLHTRNFM